MRLLLRSTLALVTLAHLGCCFGDFAQGFQEGFQEGMNGSDFNQSFCAEYRRSFVTTCTDTCATSAGEAARPTCATGCEQALTTDSTWVSQCASAATTAPVPPG